MSLFPLVAVVADRSDLAHALTRRGCVPTPAQTADVLVVEASSAMDDEVREALAHGRAHDPIARWPARELVTRIGTVFQDPEHQFLTRQVIDELLLGPRRAGIEPGAARRRADELLASTSTFDREALFASDAALRELVS